MVIYLEDKRLQAVDWMQKLQHVTAGGPLLIVGLQKLAEGDVGERPIALLEVAIALAVFVAFYREWRMRKHAPSHTSIGWFDIAAAGLLMFEAFHGAIHKPGYLRPQFLSAVVTLGLGLLHGRLHHFKQRRRYVKLDDTSLEIRTSRFRRVTLQWKDLDSVDLSGGKAVFRRSDGRHHTFRLGWFHNSETVRKEIAGHAAAAGLLLE
jgi:hypothetical protein